jgi:hypothetical protein
LQLRNLRKAQSIRLWLGGSPPGEPFPAKPRRMHQRTYPRLRVQAKEAQAITFGASASARARSVLEMTQCLYHFCALYGFGTNRLPDGISSLAGAL